jgi:hypothetical protein
MGGLASALRLSLACFALLFALPAFASKTLMLKKAYADLKSPSFSARLAAIETLAALRDEGAVDAIMPRVRDDDPTVRYGAIEALETLADPRAMATLQAAREDVSPWVAERAKLAVKSFAQSTIGKPSGMQGVKTVGFDRSNSSIAGLERDLATAASAALESKKVRLSPDAAEPTHVLTVLMQSVKQTTVGAEIQLELTGTATVTEEGNLRFATRVGATVSISNRAAPAQVTSLAHDGAKAIGQRLGEESAEFFQKL